jgi:hypothetical protein
MRTARQRGKVQIYCPSPLWVVNLPVISEFLRCTVPRCSGPGRPAVRPPQFLEVESSVKEAGGLPASDMMKDETVVMDDRGGRGCEMPIISTSDLACK